MDLLGVMQLQCSGGGGRASAAGHVSSATWNANHTWELEEADSQDRQAAFAEPAFGFACGEAQAHLWQQLQDGRGENPLRSPRAEFLRLWVGTHEGHGKPISVGSHRTQGSPR